MVVHFLGLRKKETITKLLKRLLKEGLNVRQLEQIDSTN